MNNVIDLENIHYYEPSIFHLVDLVGVIYSYLNYADGLNLLATTKYLYENTSNIRYLKLNRNGSKRYYESEMFRNHINTLIKDTAKQLNLNFYDFDWLSNVSVLSDVHTLNLRYCKQVENVDTLCNTTHLILDHTNVRYTKCLKNLMSLSLRFCQQLFDISSLGKLHYLDLSYCNVSDVSSLGNVNTLILQGCENIVDVSALTNVHILDISECINIANISALKNTYNLNLTGCEAIRSVDMLTNVSILNVNQCHNVIDVSNLVQLQTLYIHPYRVKGLELLKKRNVEIIIDY